MLNIVFNLKFWNHKWNLKFTAVRVNPTID